MGVEASLKAYSSTSSIIGSAFAPKPTLRRDLTELAVGYTLILLVLWIPRPWQRFFFLGALLWILVVTYLSFNGVKVMGLRLSSARRAFWIPALALLLAAIAIEVASRLHTLHSPGRPALFVKAFWGYAIWACVQQFLLHNFFLLRLLRLLRTPTAATIVASVLFALAHLPNPILTPITILWGLAACMLFLRYRSLYPLAIAHAILGICFAITVPAALDHDMRVGHGYFTYHQHDPLPQPE